MLIAQLSDLHVCEAGRLANGVVDTNAFAAHAFAALRAAPNRPDLVLLTGDLVEAGRPEQYRNFADLMQRLPAPVFAIPGNHDARDAMRAVLNGLVPTSDSKFIQYVIEDHPVRVIMLDTLVPGSDYGELCERRLSFLQDALAPSSGASDHRRHASSAARHGNRAYGPDSACATRSGSLPSSLSTGRCSGSCAGMCIERHSEPVRMQL